MALPYDYIAGLVDGEGCFSLRYQEEIKRQLKGQPIYPRWKAEFAIVLREDDEPLLREVCDTVGCGTVIKYRGLARYSIQGTEELNNVILPLFNKHPLHGKKRVDFELWSEAVAIIHRHVLMGRGAKGFTKNPWSADDLNTLRGLYARMAAYKANKLVTQ